MILPSQLFISLLTLNKVLQVFLLINKLIFRPVFLCVCCWWECCLKELFVDFLLTIFLYLFLFALLHFVWVFKQWWIKCLVHFLSRFWQALLKNKGMIEWMCLIEMILHVILSFLLHYVVWLFNIYTCWLKNLFFWLKLFD